MGQTMVDMRTYDIETRTFPAQPAAVVKTTIAVAAIAEWIGGAFHAAATYLTQEGAGPAGPPFARYHCLGDDRFEVEAGFPSTRVVPGNETVTPATLPGGPVAQTLHVGPYDQMTPAYDGLLAWIRDHGCAPAGDAWEVYYSDPVVEPDPATWRTLIVQPYRPVAAM